ncbi:MAG: nucleotidyltransferase family protein, partial [Clostridia bacterium]|nr:nucleotidyltransferase family protein [Clostridia bacterium]
MSTTVTVSNQMLALCRVALCGEGEIAFDRPSDERMSELYALSAHHDMAHVVSYALYRQGWLDTTGETGAKFQRAQMIAVYRYGRQEAELTALCDALERAGIEHLPLKGSEIRPLYPEPWMRTSADIDVLVHKQDLERAADVLTDTLGYRREAFVSESHDISFRTPTDVHVELHFDLIEEDRVGAVENELRNVWASTHPAAGKEWRREMDDDMFYFYHVAHMAKHFAEGGCGIRTFADLWMLDHRTEHDAAARQRRIEQGGLSSFDRTARALSETWFSGAEADDLTRRM